ncbi:MAG TPA: hypothetical protein VFC19_18345 [Candidatus Limnocylindrales bacterium]|nr:hypothetical protein [Candidatus Limnocylindrales bacterium]
MLRGSPLLSAVLEVISRVESGNISPLAALATEQTPEHWLNRSVTWTIEMGDLGAQITVWEDGSAELDLVNMAIPEAQSEHLELNSQMELELAVNRARDWVIGT